MAEKIKLKRYNGLEFVEFYPSTTHDQIIASGTPSSTTFLRGDGVWARPSNSTSTFSTSTTLNQSHAGVVIFCTNSTAITITVPADASNATFPPGTEITFIRRGAGTVTIATTNISLFSVGSGTANAGRRSIANQNEGVILIKQTGNNWQLIGAL